MEPIAKREDALLGARALFVAASAPERAVEGVLREGLLQRVGLHDRCVFVAALVERVDVRGEAFGVRVDDELGPDLFRHAVAMRDHVPELPGRVDVHQRERERRRRERLLGEAQHHRAVLADRVEHHRVLELGDGLAQDIAGCSRPRASRRCVSRWFSVSKRRHHSVSARSTRASRPARHTALTRSPERGEQEDTKSRRFCGLQDREVRSRSLGSPFDRPSRGVKAPSLLASGLGVFLFKSLERG